MALGLTKLLVLLLLNFIVTFASGAMVRLFGDTNFGLSTGSWVFEFASMGQFCINTKSFDDVASSADWTDLPQTGSFDNNQAKIAFYTDQNCTGTVRAWPTAAKNYPTNFALNGIDNQISSFMVWKTSTTVVSIAAS